METWDPKPEAPAQYRGPLGAIRTSVPGVQFGELLPEQARLMQHLAIVRTVESRLRRPHQIQPLDADRLRRPRVQRPRLQEAAPALDGLRRLAAARRQLAPACRPTSRVPHLRGGTDNFFHYAAYLGGGANPFIVDSDPNLPRLSRPQSASRAGADVSSGWKIAAACCNRLTRCAASSDRRTADLGEHYQRAFDMMTSREVASAFDISREPTALRDRYGRHTFGQSALVARRLIEAGVTFVTVNCVPWDHHGTPPQLRDGGRRPAADPAARSGASQRWSRT